MLAATTLLAATTGVLLLFKKELPALQVPAASAASEGPTAARIDQIVRVSLAALDAPSDGWRRIDRIDVRLGDGLAKVSTTDYREVQVDLATLQVLRVGHRNSDFIEQIHDGSLWFDGSKYVLALPTGLGLIALAASGVWLFFAPHILRAQRNRKGNRP